MVQLIGCEGSPRQPRTANDHAVEGEMHALFAKRTNHVILEAIE